MIVLDILAILVILGLFVLFLTQIVTPLLFGTPFFPLFCKDTSEVPNTENTSKDETELAELLKQLDTLNSRKAELEKKK